MRACDWCRSELEDGAARNARFCSQRCRQTAFRLRRRGQLEGLADRAMRFAYADPPYIGLASRFYQHEASYRGEVDHQELVDTLQGRRRDGEIDGWALSCSARSLRELLPICPEEARPCSWVKPHAVPAATRGRHNVWEAVIVVGGRPLRPGVPDSLVALPARSGGELPGRKPIAFWSWLFALLGMLPGDAFDDLFPGTETGSRAWEELSRGAGARRQPSATAWARVAAAGGDVTASTSDVAEVLQRQKAAG